ncbi:NADH-quinone oxidoreductase subunit L [Calderihabitans maritimus]|uniref:Proton-translocating NADH-quinone oxidoreductase subunit L n=1 Tax=Calderihabitans maritimus TaxID=1246530 RepID=A0A1Z5HXB8_9FIRM|nr:NADH-quinone oxidoreductase subunit L [Calderihabitans maritimus]GAW94179.1 proton-translocating NADH-quinone oxidoreductase subunit L [Calderihabitans maritimus]
MVQYAWLIPAMPLLAFIVIVAFTYKRPVLSGLVGVCGTAISLILSLAVFGSVWAGKETELSFLWADLGQLKLEMGVLLDPMSAVMFVVVSVISLLVFIYSFGYMHGDPGFSRFYAFLSLFVFSMLGLVAANNFLQIFIFWELVGLCSYLLIGFWYDQPGVALPPPLAGMRAFITTRIGDVGFLLGILVLVAAVPTLNFQEVFEFAEAGEISSSALTAAGILIFAGAVGKSAQFPLHTWLPDAMEGPTPVSALIHAATMVAAGVYLVARVMPIVAMSPQALLVIAYVGGFTAFFAATIALVYTDFKRVIGYSTISQLGYMMMALGVTGAASVGMFHLTTHAFFKALLFLAIGSAIHAVHSQDMKDMGGLGKEMKITSFAFLVGSLALAGIPPFSGFWSKDEIIYSAFHSGYVGLGILGLVAAFFTAFYIFRVYFHAFRGDVPEHMKKHHIHESPPTMTIPMLILAVFAIVVGLVGTPWHNYFAAFISPEEHHEAGVNSLALTLMVVSTLVAISAIFLAWLIYGRRRVTEEPMARSLPWLFKFLSNKWYIENFYYGVIVRYGAVGLAYFLAWFDRAVIDGLVNGVARFVDVIGMGLRRLQTGYFQFYAVIILTAATISIVYFALFWNI